MKLDAYEKELLKLDESEKISLGQNDSIEKETLIAVARETLQKDKRIKIRMSGRDLLSLKPMQIEDAPSKYSREKK